MIQVPLFSHGAWIMHSSTSVIISKHDHLQMTYFIYTLLVKTGLFINVFLNAFITWPIFVAKSNYRTHLNLSLTWILLLTVSTMMTLKSIHTFTLIWTVVVVARPIIFTRFYRTFIYICNCKVDIVNGTMMLNLKLTK